MPGTQLRKKDRPDSKMRLAKKEMMNINNRKRHLFRKAYADMYIKERNIFKRRIVFQPPITGSF